MQSKSITHENSLFIRPSSEELSELTFEPASGVAAQDLESAQDLSAVLFVFNKFICDEFILQNTHFCFITLGDELLSQVLPDECTRLGLKLAPHFLKSYELTQEFEKAYGSGHTIPEMLLALGLSEAPERLKSHENCKNLVRVLNKMLKDKHQFGPPMSVNTDKQRGKPQPVPSTPPDLHYEKQETSKIVLVRGLSYKSNDSDIEEFMYGLRIEQSVPVLDPYMQRTSLFLVKFFTEEDSSEALSYDKRREKGKEIEVTEATENAFCAALRNAEQRVEWTSRPYYLKVKHHESLAVTAELVYEFNDCIFYVLSEMKVEFSQYLVGEPEVLSYFRPETSEQPPTLTPDELSRSVKIRGFAYNTTKKAVLEFLRDFEVFKHCVFINQDSLDKSTREVIVVLNTIEEKERAIATVSHCIFQNRLLELYGLS